MAEADVEEKKVDVLAGALAEILYKNQIEALTQTLNRFRVSERAYTILGDREESVCINHHEGKWKVYTSERGHETDLRITDEIEEACKIVLYRMSDDDEEYKQMVYFFSHQMDEAPSNRASSSDIYNALKNGLHRIERTVATL